ncbi:MAG: alpha-amylase family glycosyl hydrolase [Candidatus Kariarchaeaceae archaeon]
MGKFSVSKALLFEVNTRYWLYQLSEKYGEKITLGNIPDQELNNIALHFDWVWLMGVWDNSILDQQFIEEHPGLIEETERVLDDWTVDDILGSPYSVKSYTIHPVLGSEEEFGQLRQRFNERGVKVMVDFVPNHFGYHTQLIYEEPDYFINIDHPPDRTHSYMFFKAETSKGTRWMAYGKDPYFSPWEDTVQVNIFNPEMRRYLTELLHRLADMADGVRCDMAMLINTKIFSKTWSSMLTSWEKPTSEFWKDTISTVKAKNPAFTFLAEVYWNMEWELLQLGFDYCYDKRLYDRLIFIQPETMREHLTADISYQERMCRFIENHDEPRAADTMGETQSIAAAATILTLPGLSLIHHDQMVGAKIKIPVQLRRKNTETIRKSLQRQYIRILNFVSDQISLEATWQFLDVMRIPAESDESVLAWSWSTPEKLILIIINYAGNDAQARIRLPEHPLLESEDLELYDSFTSQTYQWKSEDLRPDGLYIKLHEYQFHLFSVHQV